MKSKFALSDTSSHHFIILLQPRFVMKALLDAIDWFECANEVLKKDYFEWHLCSEEGPVILADNGMVLSALRQPKSINKAATIIVFSGSKTHSKSINNQEWLRKKLISKAQIYQFTPDFLEQDQNDFLGNYLTEMMAEMVLPKLDQSQNEALLARIKQKSGLSLRVTDTRIHKALSLMRDNIESPLDSKTLASQSFLSLRQLERLFKHYFNESPSKHYTKLRLKSAKKLLVSTDLKVGDVSQACGFSTVPYFCKAYRDCFGITPLQSKDEQQKQTRLPSLL